MNLDICMYVGMCVCILSINTEKLWILQELKEKAQMSLSIKMPDSPGLFAVVFSQIFFKSSSFRTPCMCALWRAWARPKPGKEIRDSKTVMSAKMFFSIQAKSNKEISLKKSFLRAFSSLYGFQRLHCLHRLQSLRCLVHPFTATVLHIFNAHSFIVFLETHWDTGQDLLDSANSRIDHSLHRVEEFLSPNHEEGHGCCPAFLHRLIVASLIFVFFVMVWVLFFVLYEPCSCSYGFTRIEGCEDGLTCADTGGDVKSVVDAIYMAIITYSTVGFGDFTPDTRVGRIFSCVVMVLGVVSFFNVVSAVADVIAKRSVFIGANCDSP